MVSVVLEHDRTPAASFPNQLGGETGKQEGLLFWCRFFCKGESVTLKSSFLHCSFQVKSVTLMASLAWTVKLCTLVPCIVSISIGSHRVLNHTHKHGTHNSGTVSLVKSIIELSIYDVHGQSSSSLSNNFFAVFTEGFTTGSKSSSSPLE